MAQELKVKELMQFCRETMDLYGLNDWELITSKRTRRCAGRCSHRNKQIMVSHYHLKRFPENTIYDTILHEIAHALTPDDPGHGPQWKAQAQMIGAIPKASHVSRLLSQVREEG